MIGYLVGSVFGCVFIVAIFMAIAGRRLQSGRQIFAAYLAVAIAAFFVAGTGDANGGPPNFANAQYQLLGAAIGGLGHWLLLKFGRQKAPAP